MAENITQRLLNLKDIIDNSTTKLNQAEGRMGVLKEQLKEIGCESVKQAEKELEEIDEQILTNEDILNKGVKELEEQININIGE